MPKARPQPGARSIQGRLLVFCEGAKDKSESAYFKALINDRRNPDNRLEVKVIDTKKNTARELVYGYAYNKSNPLTYAETKHFLDQAKINAKRCREYQLQCNPVHKPIYEMNPYTNVDKLVTAIEQFSV